MRERGNLFVITGPSGVGKSTVIGGVMERDENIRFSVSVTTRAPRPGEQDGVNYHFIGEDEFRQMIARDELLEYAEYVGKFYGTPAKYVDEHLDRGHDVILDIEVQGAMQVKEHRPEAVMIFLSPPDIQTLIDRLHKRGTDDEETIQKRIRRAEEELAYISAYDYEVVSYTLENCIRDMEAIIRAEKLRTK